MKNKQPILAAEKSAMEATQATARTKTKNSADPLYVVHVASECSPFIQTGGLGDVVGTLPRTQAAQGFRVAVFLPKYRDIPTEWVQKMEYIAHFNLELGWRNQYCGLFRLKHREVTYYFIDNEFYFGFEGLYSRGDFEGERFAFFDKAVLACIDYLAEIPDIVHCHDWQTGMIPYLLKTRYAWRREFSHVGSIMTIHNLAFQGCFPWTMMREMLGLPDCDYTDDKLRYYDSVNFLKTGITYADQVTTVSPTYALEIQRPEQGEHMDGLLRARANGLHGVLNGIDTKTYDPQTDPLIPGNFSAKDLSGKAMCKKQLQTSLKLGVREDVPIVAMVSRLTAQKGLDLVEAVWSDLMELDIQVVVLGKGDPRYESLFTWAGGAFPGKVTARLEFNQTLARRIYAGADMFLMPSLFEPCGLSQMIAMRYGTIPVVRETGGLKDTVIPYNKYTGEGNGFSFYSYNAHDMLYTVKRALGYYHQKDVWNGIMAQAMDYDSGWEHASKEYIRLYRSIL